MNGHDAGDPEVRALTLLIQLFGREAIDALSAAGFRDNETIARAGPERLSEAAGIPLALARRIAAVAVEAHEVAAINAREGLMTEDEAPAVQTEAHVVEDYLAGVAAAGVPSASVLSAEALLTAETPLAAGVPAAEASPAGAPFSEAPQAEAPATAAVVSSAEAPSAEAPPADVPSPERHVRRPLRRPHSRLVHPDVPAVPRHAAGGAGRKRGRERAARQPAPAAPNTDPFIDDVGLVSWMGFAGRGGGTVPFSVADAILETVEEPASIMPVTPPVLQEIAQIAPVTATQAPTAARASALTPEPGPADRPVSSPAATAAPSRTPAAARMPAPATEPAPAARQHSPAAIPAPGAAAKGSSDSAGGSFWSFGRLLQSPDRPERTDTAQSPKASTTPRRRIHDGH